MTFFVDFPSGLPGFPGRRSFSIEHIEGTLLARLVPAEEAGPSFLVLTEPLAFFPDLGTLELDEAAQASIKATGPEGLATWLILTVRPGLVTANLLGPIVVNVDRGLAVQVVRKDLGWPVAAPLPRQVQPCLS